MNNYVALGILPRPILRKGPKSAGRAPRLGCFPDSTLDTIARVNALKKEGLTMDRIAETIRTERKDEEAETEAVAEDMPLAASMSQVASGSASSSGSTVPFPGPSRERRSPVVSTGAPLHLTVEHMEHPAYMVNNNFDVEWCNEAANDQILGTDLSADIAESNLFSLILGNSPAFATEDRDQILRFHLSLAKKRLSQAAICRDSAAAGIIAKLYDEVETVTSRDMIHSEVNLAPPGKPENWHRL